MRKRTPDKQPQPDIPPVKRCPLSCNGEAKAYHIGSNAGGVRCSKCNLRLEAASVIECVEAWNDRTGGAGVNGGI